VDDGDMEDDVPRWAEVVYARPESGSWRDLRVIRLDADGR
jgi:hypothetical protein